MTAASIFVVSLQVFVLLLAAIVLLVIFGVKKRS